MRSGTAHLSAILVGLSALVACGPGAEIGPSSPESSGSPEGGTSSGEGGTSARAEAGPDASADSGWVFSATTTVANLTQNNTSACGSATSPCSGAWSPSQAVHYSSGDYSGQTQTVDGFWDNVVSPGSQAPSSTEGYLSKVPLQALLPGYDVPVWVETQNWWGGGNGHIDNGESSASGEQIANQIADQVSRGVAGQVVDWYGPGTTADLALPFIQSNAEATQGHYQFAVMVDKGYFTSCGETVACVDSAISYVSSHYATSPAYLKDAAGHPLIFFFVNQYYAAEYALLQSAGIDYQNSRFVMYEPNGFPGDSPGNTVGGYGWVNPADGAAATETTGSKGMFDWEADFGFTGFTSFLTNAEANQSSYIVSQAYKGFDDNLANWSGDRIIDQQCGRTWLESFDHTGSFGGSSSYLASVNYLALGKRLDFVMVDTWDDYEEGTEIETGIDNCLSRLDVSLAGHTLSWNPVWGTDPMNSAVSGTEDTVYQYSVYLAEPGSTDLMPLTSVRCSSSSCPHSLDVSPYGITGGPYVFYVQAVGQPSIVNTLSGATSGTFT